MNPGKMAVIELLLMKDVHNLITLEHTMSRTVRLNLVVLHFRLEHWTSLDLLLRLGLLLCMNHCQPSQKENV